MKYCLIVGMAVLLITIIGLNGYVEDNSSSESDRFIGT